MGYHEMVGVLIKFDLESMSNFEFWRVEAVGSPCNGIVGDPSVGSHAHELEHSKTLLTVPLETLQHSNTMKTLLTPSKIRSTPNTNHSKTP